MANTPVAGSWGRIKVLTIAPVLTTPVFTWTGTALALWDGFSWKAEDGYSGGVPFVHTFEDTIDAQGVAYGTLIRGGVADPPTINIEGIQNIDATTATQLKIPLHSACVMDFIFFKNATSANYLGYVAVPCVVESFTPGGKQEDKGFAYTMRVRASGPLSAYLTLGT